MRIQSLECLFQFSAPSEVTDLQKKTQTNNSITLQWEAPADPHADFYMYLVQWAGGEHPQRERDPQRRPAYQTGKTNETWYVVEALVPGTLYNFSVWSERNDVGSSTQSLHASTGEMGPLLPGGGLRSDLGATRSEWIKNPISL